MEFFQNDMSFLVGRIEVVSIALLALLCLETIFCSIAILFKKNVTALPLIEICLRPIAIFLSDRLNRIDRTPVSLFVRGVIVFGVLSAFAFGLFSVLNMFFLSSLVDVILLLFVLSPFRGLLVLRSALKKNVKKGGYFYFSQALNRNLIWLDQAGQYRHAIDLILLCFVEWFVSPILIYLLFGMPAVLFFVVASVCMRVTGEAKKNQVFSFVPRFLVRVGNIFSHLFVRIFIPFISVFIPKGNPLKSLTCSGLSAVSIFAYALGITIGGGYQDRHGQKIDRAWIGAENTSACISLPDVLRGGYLYALAVFFIYIVFFLGFVFS